MPKHRRSKRFRPGKGLFHYWTSNSIRKSSFYWCNKCCDHTSENNTFFWYIISLWAHGTRLSDSTWISKPTASVLKSSTRWLPTEGWAWSRLPSTPGEPTKKRESNQSMIFDWCWHNTRNVTNEARKNDQILKYSVSSWMKSLKDHGTFFFSFYRTGRPLVSYGLATYESGELAKMEVRLSPRPSTPNPEEFPYHVVDTDYSSYAVIASCEELCRGQHHAGTTVKKKTLALIPWNSEASMHHVTFYYEVMAWILGRAAAISPQALGRIYDKLRSMTEGLDPRRFMKVWTDVNLKWITTAH